MNDASPTALDDLISRHFDETLSPADHQQLTFTLTKNPDACSAFASTALLHAGLERLAPPLPAVRKGRAPRWLAMGAAAAAVAIGAGILFLSDHKQAGFRITQEDVNAPPDGEPRKPKPPGLTKRIVKSPASAQPPGSALDVTELLSRYYVNASPTGLTVSQALVQLEAAIKFENAFNRPELDQLTFTATSSYDPETPDPVVYTPLLPPMTAREYLETCARPCRVIRNPGSVPIQFSAIQPATFVSSGLSAITIDASPGKLAWLASPGSVGPHIQFGFPAGPGGILATPMIAAGERTLVQLCIATKYLKLRRSFLPSEFKEESGLIMPDPEYQMFMRAISLKEANLFTAPSVIVRLHQKSKVEMLHDTRTGDDAKATVGLTQEVQTSATGELFRVEGLVDLRLMEGVAMPRGPSFLQLVSTGTSGIQSYQTEYELYLPDRSTALFTVDSPQPEGFVTLVAITATVIDPAGQPVNVPQTETLPVETPVEGK